MSPPVLLAVEQLRRTVPGGVGRYATCLLDGLVALGAPVDGLLASRHRGPGQDPLERWGIPVLASSLPGPLLTRLWDTGLLRAPSGAPVVHAVSLAAPPPARRVAGAPGQVLTVTVHDLAWRVHPEATTARGRRWHDAALGRALARARAVVVPSAPVAAALGAAGADPSRVHVIAHGVDHLPAPDLEGAGALLERLGVTGEYLLAAGTLEPRKNLARLAAAYAKARPLLPGDWPLVVVGPAGWGDAGLPGPRPGARLGAQPGADGRSGRGGAGPGGNATASLIAAGAVPDGVLAALYAGARAFCYVPLAEGYGLPPVEAMTCGTPVLASTAVPSVDPELGSRSPALCVDPLSVDAIAAGLVAVSGDESLRAALVARGAARVAGQTWRRSAEAHALLWEAVAPG